MVGGGMGTGVITRLNRVAFEPILMPGQRVRIQQGNEFAYYELPRYTAPELLPQTVLDLADYNTGVTLSAMSDTGQQTGRTSRITDMDVDALSLGHYRFVAIDTSILFEIRQPGSVGRFTSKTGPLRFHYGNTMTHYQNQMWSMLPELFVFEDVSPPTVTAYNMDMNRVKKYARLAFFGFRYPLQFLQTKIDPSTGQVLHIDPSGKAHAITAALTVSVGGRG